MFAKRAHDKGTSQTLHEVKYHDKLSSHLWRSPIVRSKVEPTGSARDLNWDVRWPEEWNACMYQDNSNGSFDTPAGVQLTFGVNGRANLVE